MSNGVVCDVEIEIDAFGEETSVCVVEAEILYPPPVLTLTFCIIFECDCGA